MNEVILIGHLGQDAEIGETSNAHKKYAKLSLATGYSYKDKSTGEQKDKTDWHRIVVWGDGTCNYLGQYAKKGSKMLVKGKLATRTYEKTPGDKRYVTEVVVQGPDCQVTVFKPAGSGGVPGPDSEPENRWGGDDSAPGSKGAYEPKSYADDEIPF